MNYYKKIVSIIASIWCVAALGTPSAMAAEKKLRLAYVEWDCATASTYLAKAVLEDRLGYTVEAIPVSGPVMWMSLKTKDADAMVTAWLPVTHADMLASVKGDVEIIGKIADGARLGLVVPDYVPVRSVEELSANAKQFKNKIIGIDAGAGIMNLSEKLLDVYGITNMELVQGSGALMTATLQDAIRKNEWLVVTGWSPHWMFGKWPLRYLDDPKNSMGNAESIFTAARKDLEKDHPEAFAFLSRFHYTGAEQLELYMSWNQENDDPEENARKFIKENPDLVADWLGDTI